MDCGRKRIIQAVAGSGKTQFLIDTLDQYTNTAIITYTKNNQMELKKRILKKFQGIPINIHIFGFWQFVYSFCLAPFLEAKPQGICFDRPQHYDKNSQTKDGRFYSNKISKTLLGYSDRYPYIKRIDKYFSRVLIDEVQDLGSDDIDWLLSLINCNAEILAVGDFYQRTFQTSTRGNKNKRLNQNYNMYKKKFIDTGFEFDTSSLIHSQRCSKGTCDFIRTKLGIEIYACPKNESDTCSPQLLLDKDEICEVWHNDNIIKLFVKESHKFACNKALNWGASKGLTFESVCVILPDKLIKFFNEGDFRELTPKTKAGFYVACTRARGKIFFLSRKNANSFNKSY